MYRQGDILLVPTGVLPELPEGLAQEPARPDGRVVLAEGEATGHAHTVVLDDPGTMAGRGAPARLMRGGPSGDELYLVLTAPATVRHEEHSAVSLDAGVYLVRRQRVYTPAGIRSVVD